MFATYGGYTLNPQSSAGPHKPKVNPFLLSLSVVRLLVPGKSPSGRCGLVKCPVQSMTASKTRVSFRPPLLSVSTSHRPVEAKSKVRLTLTTVVWKHMIHYFPTIWTLSDGIISLGDTDLEANVWQQLEGLSVEPHVEQHLGVVHVVGQLSRRREVAEGHHLLGAVDDHRLVDVGTSRLRPLLQRDNIKKGNQEHNSRERKKERKITSQPGIFFLFFFF